MTAPARKSRRPAGQSPGIDLGDRLASAAVAAVGGALTAALLWIVVALWLGRYFLTLEELHFIDTVLSGAVLAGVVGFAAPNALPEFFGRIWHWLWALVSKGGAMPPP